MRFSKLLDGSGVAASKIIAEPITIVTPGYLLRTAERQIRGRRRDLVGMKEMERAEKHERPAMFRIALPFPSPMRYAHHESEHHVDCW